MLSDKQRKFCFFLFFWCTLISRAKFEGQPWSILFLGYISCVSFSQEALVHLIFCVFFVAVVWANIIKNHFLPKIPAGEQIGFQTTRCKSSFFWNLYLGSLIWKTTFWKSWFSCPRSSILREHYMNCLGRLKNDRWGIIY